MISKSLTTGSSFNDTDWSASVTPEVLGTDEIAITDGTLTPIFARPDNRAYYVQLICSSTSNGSLTIRHSTDDTLTVNLTSGAETLKLKDGTAESFSLVQSGQEVTVNFYICPTHLDGEVLFVQKLDPDRFPFENWGLVVVDPAGVTVTPTWTIQTSGRVTIKNVSYRPADVVYQGGSLIQDCGRSDLFPKNWTYANSWDNLRINGFFWEPTTNVNLTLVGQDHPAPYNDAWGGFRGYLYAAGNEPFDIADYGDTFGVANEVVHRAVRADKEQDPGNGEWTINGPMSNPFLSDMIVRVARDSPSPSTPYPLPIYRVSLFCQDQLALSGGTCTTPGDTEGTANVDANIGNIAWTLQATISRASCPGQNSSTITWTHPFV